MVVHRKEFLKQGLKLWLRALFKCCPKRCTFHHVVTKVIPCDCMWNGPPSLASCVSWAGRSGNPGAQAPAAAGAAGGAALETQAWLVGGALLFVPRGTCTATSPFSCCKKNKDMSLPRILHMQPASDHAVRLQLKYAWTILDLPTRIAFLLWRRQKRAAQ